MADERTEFTVLGRLIGTATDWDSDNGWSLMLYDFTPADGVDLPSGSISIDFEEGAIDGFESDGVTATTTRDIIDVLGRVKKAEETKP
jgi:hypothetical protein